MARRWRWAGNQNSLTLVAGTAQAVAMGGSFEKDETVVRIVGQVLWNLSAISTANRINAAGIIQMAGPQTVSSLPDPLADFDAPWIWHSFVPMGPGNVAADFQLRLFSVDNRAMRKFDGDSSLFMVAHAVTSTTVIAWGLRFGIKLV